MNITGEQVRAAYAAAPVPIRKAFSSDDTTRIILDLQTRHKLHVDSTGVLGRQVGYLLLGLISPMEFLGGLVEAGVSADAARDIVSEVNEKVFIPLRAKMQGVEPTVRQSAPVPPSPAPQPATMAQSQIARAPLASVPMIGVPHAQVVTTNGGWPAAPAGNWQPAAAVHVYVPGPAPAPQQPTQHTAIPVTEPTHTPTLAVSVQQPTQTPISTETPVRTVRPVPAPPANLPGIPAEGSLEKTYVADPYREQPL